VEKNTCLRLWGKTLCTGKKKKENVPAVRNPKGVRRKKEGRLVRKKQKDREKTGVKFAKGGTPARVKKPSKKTLPPPDQSVCGGENMRHSLKGQNPGVPLKNHPSSRRKRE